MPKRKASYHLPTFTYEPLLSSRHIRVLELQREDDKSVTLAARLLVIDLDDDDHIPYTALSYTWGPPNFSEDLVVDSTILHITPNLAGALRHFRAISCSKWIWADAVCINQKDKTEKSSQIPLMGKIYRDASRVMIWLGDKPRDISLVKTVQIASRRIITERGGLHEEDRLALSKSVSSIVQLPWFNRRWVVQELVLNPSVSFFCGHLELAWQYLITAIQYALEDYYPIQIRTRGRRCWFDPYNLPMIVRDDRAIQLHDDEGHVVASDEAEEPADIRNATVGSYSSSPFATVLTLWNLWQSWSMPFSQSEQLDKPMSSRILDLLYSFNHFECSDSRERVYALIGLAQGAKNGDDNINFKIDYCQTTEQVYIIFAKILVRAGHLREVLDSALSRKTCKDTDLPSWVSDWRNSLNSHQNRRHLKRSQPYRTRVIESGRYHVISAPAICMYQANGIDSSTVTDARHKEKILMVIITPFSIIWMGPFFLTRHDWTVQDWATWASASVLEFWRFTLENRSKLWEAEDDWIIWNAAIAQAIHQLTGCSQRSDLSGHIAHALYKAIMMRWSKGCDLEESENMESEMRDIMRECLDDEVTTREALAASTGCLFICHAHPVHGLHLLGSASSSDIAIGDVILSLSFDSSSYERDDHSYVVRQIAKVRSGSSLNGMKILKYEQYAYKMISMCTVIEIKPFARQPKRRYGTAELQNKKYPTPSPFKELEDSNVTGTFDVEIFLV